MKIDWELKIGHGWQIVTDEYYNTKLILFYLSNVLHNTWWSMLLAAPTTNSSFQHLIDDSSSTLDFLKPLKTILVGYLAFFKGSLNFWMNYSLTLTVDDSIIVWSHNKRLAAWYSLSSCQCIPETPNLWMTVVHGEITGSTPEKETRHILLETHIPNFQNRQIWTFTYFNKLWIWVYFTLPHRFQVDSTYST